MPWSAAPRSPHLPTTGGMGASNSKIPPSSIFEPVSPPAYDINTVTFLNYENPTWVASHARQEPFSVRAATWLVFLLGAGERIFEASRRAGTLRGGIDFVIAHANLHRSLGLVLLISLVTGAYLVLQQINLRDGQGGPAQGVFERAMGKEYNAASLSTALAKTWRCRTDSLNAVGMSPRRCLSKKSGRFQQYSEAIQTSTVWPRKLTRLTVNVKRRYGSGDGGTYRTSSRGSTPTVCHSTRSSTWSASSS